MLNKTERLTISITDVNCHITLEKKGQGIAAQEVNIHITVLSKQSFILEVTYALTETSLSLKKTAINHHKQ